jgi:hypothetical protein
MRFWILSAFLLLLWSGLFAQREETVFRHLRLSGVWGAYNFNMSFYDNEVPNIQGGYGGFEFNRLIFMGWGGYRQRDFLQNGTVGDIPFKLKYNGFVLGITPWSHKVLHPRIGFLVGPGRVMLPNDRSDRVRVLKPSLGLELNVFEILRLGVEGGYRFITRQEIPELRTEDTSAPFVQVDIRFGCSW